ncbi:alpha/beta fold hydrolase [Streptomyces sp. NPDC002004]
MTFVGIGGVPHHVVVEGDGPVCVLSPGLGMSWFDWDPVVPLLAAHRTVVRFDRPGLGLSAAARTWPTLTGEAERIACVLDAFGFDGPVTVVGHSLAGFHCEAFARLHPGRAAALVLVDPSIEERPRPRRAPAAWDAVTHVCGTALGLLGVPRALVPRLRRAAVRAVRIEGGDPAPYELTRRAYGTSRALHAILREYVRYEAEAVDLALLRRTRPLPPGLPVTVVAAVATDHTAPDWIGRQRSLADLLGGSFRVATPSGHLVMLDRPADVASAILATGPAG